jgi:hypothetical protein
MFSECVITVVWIQVPLASQPAANQSRIPHAGLLLSSVLYAGYVFFIGLYSVLHALVFVKCNLWARYACPSVLLSAHMSHFSLLQQTFGRWAITDVTQSWPIKGSKFYILTHKLDLR